MIDPSHLTPEDLAAVKQHLERSHRRAVEVALGCARHELERHAMDLELKAKEIRDLLNGRAAFPEE